MGLNPEMRDFGKRKNRLQINSQIYKFVIVGISSNLVLYLIYFLLTTSKTVPALVASIFVYVIGVFSTYLINRNWTFSSPEHRLIRYLVVYVIGFFLTSVASIIFLYVLFIDYIFSQLLTVFIVAVCSYLMQKNWVFRT